jgi:FemAB family protein
MTNSLKKNILEEFDSVDFSLKDWAKVLSKSSEVLVFHLPKTVEYYVEYFSGENLSIVLYDHNKAVGVYPLFIYRNNNKWVISGNDMGLVRPLFVKYIAKKTKKRLEKKIANIIYFISSEFEINSLHLLESGMKLSSWYLLWLKSANKLSIKHQLAIDIRPSINEIKLKFRKSYKPLIGRAFREWDIDVCESNIDNVFEEFRMLHKEVSGRETRTIETWNIQKEQINNNQAFLITVRDKGLLVGGGFFTFSKDFGYYSVGAYKRELFNKPIGHGVQMKAIEVLKEKGCFQYNIGQKVISLDKHKPTEKEVSISHFKEGFGGFVFLEPHIEIKINE